MARYMLLVASCVLVVACFLYTVDAASPCRTRCNLRCRVYGRRLRNGLQWLRQSRLFCLRRCYNLFENCAACPSNAFCAGCKSGYKLNSNGFCVAAAPAPAPCKYHGLTCDNGFVLERTKFCDGFVDCPDESDEGTLGQCDLLNTCDDGNTNLRFINYCDCSVNCVDKSDEESYSHWFGCVTCKVGQYACDAQVEGGYVCSDSPCATSAPAAAPAVPGR